MDELHDGLTMIVALSPSQHLQAIGTGFVVSRFEDGAVCVTAAHNFFLGIHRVQFPHGRHHHSTPAEFQPNFERVELARTGAIFRKGNNVIVARITGACWDKRRDLCVFETEPQEGDRPRFHPREIRIAAEQPRQGQKVAILGYAGIENCVDDHETAGMIASRLEVRVGTVCSIGEGLLISGRVAETTVPVFPGMSGSPAVIWGGFKDIPLVFGLVSSDAEATDPAEKDDFSRPGRSHVSMLDVERVTFSNDALAVRIKIGPLAAVLGRMRSPFYHAVQTQANAP